MTPDRIEAARRVVCWFSCGAASAVATKLAIQTFGGECITVAYCATGSEHPDNTRFMADCAAWFGVDIEPIRSDKYSDTWDVWTKRSYLAGINGAPCTTELKVIPRLTFQRPSDIHVFGYTADKTDVRRAQLLRDNYPELTVITPLIDNDLKKDACLALVMNAGIELPPLYSMGFQNNNCLPCVKATSPDYWSLVRKRFPDEFNRMASLARTLDVRLARIADVRVFIDDIPTDWPTTNPISPSCDFLCHIIEQDWVNP